MLLVILDTETSGFKDNTLVELASIIRTSRGDTYQYYSLAKPRTPIEDSAAEVHHITNHQVANERLDAVVAAEWFNDIQGLSRDLNEPIIYVGHNISYDLRVLRKYVTIPLDVLTICTMKLGRRYTPQSPNHKLVTLHEFLGLTGAGVAHSAMGDVETCLGILDHYVKTLGVTAAYLAREQKHPVKLKVMPFGKHANREFSVIDSSYFNFMLGLGDLDTDVRYSMQEEVNRRIRAGVR